MHLDPDIGPSASVLTRESRKIEIACDNIDKLINIEMRPYGQSIGPTDAPSRRLSMIVAQEPTQSLAAANRPLAAAVRVPRKRQDVALPLVV